MKNSDIFEANRLGWEETAPIHKNLKFEGLMDNFKNLGYSLLDEVEQRIFTEIIKIKGKDVIQLCCNNARELLSVKNIGANRCVGIDFSESFINQGKEFAQIANQDLELYAMNVYDVPEKFFNSFDVVYITIGAITWLPDLPKFFQLISKLLKQGGYLFLYDYHPVVEMYDPEQSENHQIPKYSYFRTEPFVEEGGQDYYDNSATIKSTIYSFSFTLTDVFMNSINSGLEIKDFREYKHDISNSYKFLEKYDKYPMCFSLVCQKK